jgi:hypothetical protein
VTLTPEERTELRTRFELVERLGNDAIELLGRIGANARRIEQLAAKLEGNA